MTIDDAALRALCDAATPGPWRLGTVPAYVDVFSEVPDELGRNVPIADCSPYDWQHKEDCRANAAFIAAAREALPALLDRVAAAEKRAEAAERALVAARSDCDHFRLHCEAAEAKLAVAVAALTAIEDLADDAESEEPAFTEIMKRAREALAATGDGT